MTAPARTAELGHEDRTARSDQLRGRLALVTGAGRGIGRAVARHLAAAGADVVLVARSAGQLDDLARELAGLGSRVQARPLDVTSPGGLDHLLADPDLTDLDILVNCAGSNIPAPFVEVRVDDLDRLLDLNLRATFLVTQRVVRSWVERGRGGAVVTVTSQMGHVGAPDRSVYCATKHALEGLTKALGVELAPRGIRVNSVAPTFVATDLTTAWLADPGFRSTVLQSIPLGRLVTVDEVAAAVTFLAGPGAAGITGTSLLVDGGWTAR